MPLYQLGIVFDTRRYGRMRVESAPSTEHQWQYLQDFENRGGIRIHMNRDGKYGTIEMAVKPTAEQKKKLRSFINAVGGNVDIDFMDENYNTTHAVSYEGVTPTRALSGITTFYDKGIKPKGNESYSISRDEIVSIAESEGTVSYSLVKDEAKIAELETSPKRIGYRNMVLNEDGTLSAPMASSLSYPSRKKDTEIKMSVSELGKWEQADEHPELVNDKGKVTIYQPENGAGTTVNYDPYIHSRQDRVNTQLKGAWRRPNLVYVEVEIPTTDLESGYQADKAALPVGAHEWAGGSGIVMLSMYDKPVRIADWNDVADDWMKRFGNEPIHFDIIPPQLLPILAERGANITSPHPGLGVDVYKAYDKFKAEQGVSYSLNRNKGKKMRGAADRNTSEFNQPITDKGNPILSRFGAKLSKNYETAINNTIKSIEANGRLGDHEFIYELDKALLGAEVQSINESKYVHIGDGITLRVSDHYSSSRSFDDLNNNKDNYGVVIKLKNNRFSDYEGVDYLEYVYFPDLMDVERQISVLKGIVEFIRTRDFKNMPTPDTIHTSGKFAKQDKINYSLNRTDIDYLDAVNRGDMETAQKDDIRYSINRDDIATPEMEAEANKELTESQKAAKAIADEIEARIKKIAQNKELTFEQIELPPPIVGYRKQYLWGYITPTPLSDMKQITLLYPYVSTWVSKTIPLYL